MHNDADDTQVGRAHGDGAGAATPAARVRLRKDAFGGRDDIGGARRAYDHTCAHRLEPRRRPQSPLHAHARARTCVKMDATPSTDTRVPGATRSASERSTASVMWRGISPVGTDSGASCEATVGGVDGTNG